MRQEDWIGAKEAFARCVKIDDEDGESWSNLASMYLRIEQVKKFCTSQSLYSENRFRARARLRTITNNWRLER